MFRIIINNQYYYLFTYFVRVSSNGYPNSLTNRMKGTKTLKMFAVKLCNSAIMRNLSMENMFYAGLLQVSQ